MQQSAPPPYESLTPDAILDALESIGLQPNGSLLALNSYENRVYQAGLEDQGFVIAKFYRPQRWTDAAIAEEHDFTQQLADAELSVVNPMAIGQELPAPDGVRALGIPLCSVPTTGWAPSQPGEPR